jgi:hypothetical protein
MDIMSKLKDMAEEKASQRTITVTTYKAGHGRAIVEGKLMDQRFRENFLLTGDKRPAGEFHDMIVRFLVNTSHLTIEDVDAEIIKVPRQECSKLYDSLAVIKGVRISKGFTQKIKSLLGGVHSCTHLRELVEAMGPAVIQGVFCIVAESESALRTIIGNQQMRKHFADSVVNSCYVWREDGPEFKQILGLLDDKQEIF